nr:hypothetical protein [Dulcicalothrix desertica]
MAPLQLVKQLKYILKLGVLGDNLVQVLFTVPKETILHRLQQELGTKLGGLN